MRIKAEETCCVVVDYQERLMPAIAEREQLLHYSACLLEGLGILDIPVLITTQYAKGLGRNVPEIHAAAGTEEFCDKKSFDICGDAAIREKLKSMGRKNVILCGIEAHVCVLLSVIGLCEEGYQPVVVEDCVSAARLHDKEIAIERARSEGAIVTTCESLLFELTASAEHERFKQISDLVKKIRIFE